MIKHFLAAFILNFVQLVNDMNIFCAYVDFTKIKTMNIVGYYI